MDLPAPVSAALARGVALYLREAPANEVPAGLRRFRSFREKALAPHRAKLISALDDEDFRSDVAEWLDESPPLKKEDARILQIAVVREEGWESELAGAAKVRPKAPTKTETERLREELQTERSRAAKAKEDLRAARESARNDVHAAERRADEAQAEIKELKAQLRDAQADLRSARADADKAARAAEKEARKLRRDADRAVAAREKAEARVAALKAQVAERDRRVASLESRLQDERTKGAAARKRAGKPAPLTAPPARRAQLPVPKGRLADAPETLQAWLGAEQVRLIVDGYNVGKAESGFPEMDLEAMRTRVIDELAKLARKFQVETIVVFDGADVARGAARRTKGLVKVEYSKADAIADDHIVELVRDLPPHPVVVATNDRELQGRVSELRATVATSDQLLALMRGRKLS